MDEDTEDVRARMQDGIASALPDNYVTRWVALVEVMDSDGDRAVWMLAPDGAKAWDTLGMLEYARQIEMAATVQDRLEE